jgi:hypothetical protein
MLNMILKSLLHKKGTPPPPEGFPPKILVQVFYTQMNKCLGNNICIDPITVQDCCWIYLKKGCAADRKRKTERWCKSNVFTGRLRSQR